MPPVPFPISSDPGAMPQESGGRLINTHVEQAAQGARFPFIWRRCPGLRQVLLSDRSHLRGAYETSSGLLMVWDNRVTIADWAGGVMVETDLGALSGTERVTIARNNGGIVCVTENGPFELSVNAAPDPYPDVNLPLSVNSCCDLGGYIFFSQFNGTIWATDLNTLDVASNSFASAETNRDGLHCVKAFGGELYAFGEETIEPWSITGDSPFPAQPNMGAIIPLGAAGPHAIAGHESGFSKALLFAGSDGRVYMLQGYAPMPISTAAVERAIAALPDKGVLEASVYMAQGQAIWSLTAPDLWTWEFNLNTTSWSERRSYGRQDWRAGGTVKFRGEWYAGSRDNGQLYVVDPFYFREGDDPLIMIIESGVPDNFPSRGHVDRFWANWTTAVGNAAGEDPVEKEPKVLISFSPDAGFKWIGPVQRELGQQGEGETEIRVMRNGRYSVAGPRWRMQVSDPVHAAFMGGFAEIRPL